MLDVKDAISTRYWYAIYTKPRTEKKVYERFVEKGYISYLPLLTGLKQWSDRKKKVSVPLIPGYVFVSIDKEQLFDTMRVQGAVGVLRYLGKPAIIRDYEIENLKILMNDTEQLCDTDVPVFEKGEEVEVIAGSMKGLKGKSVNIQGKHRIVVEVEAIGSRLVVNVPITFVRKINAPVLGVAV